MGFDPESAASGAYSGIPLDAYVFENGIYHMKASELILHFLLTHLDSTRFKREFFDCWPIGDARQARDFRSHTFKWLEDIRHQSTERQDHRWPLDVPVRRSYIDECKGIRFEQVLWALTTFVACAMLRRGGAWASYIKHPLIEDCNSISDKEGMQKLADATANCRMRYGRRLRDRLRAQQQWQTTIRDLQESIADARDKQQRVHEQFRICRKQMGSQASDVDAVPRVDATPREIEEELEQLATRAAKLWARSYGWVEENAKVVEMVEAVMENRANSVRLDGRKDLKLVPAPQMADEWTKWLATQHKTPFRATTQVDLHVLTQMATACVNTLRRNLTANDADISWKLDTADETSTAADLPDRSEQLYSLDTAIKQQGTRIDKLKRLRLQLNEQRDKIAQLMHKDSQGTCISFPTSNANSIKPAQMPSKSVAQPMTERVNELAQLWEEMASGGDDEEYPRSIVNAALKGVAIKTNTPFSSVGLSRESFSDYHASPLTRITNEMASLSCTRKRDLDEQDSAVPVAKRRQMVNCHDELLIDEDAPDFLVD
ncbi:hypothetical protein IWW36_000740 [Coemansia brasiliensis]|uniref:HAUS augmin-like complex subunit 6 N-terminal domain-containing protein n=1 Tax=Coemansia brasiliensis TaxID=2650707 RepID=A0A9W8M2Q4_9FUNG|nr:hypothetical protein IWW36_000740 [Coemansia brasiliensis]